MTLFETNQSGTVALDDGTRRRTFGELELRIGRLGRLLRDELGIPQLGHAALITPNRIEGVELVLASVVHGVVLTPVSHHLTKHEIAHVLADSGARVVFADASLVDSLPPFDGPIVTLDALDARLEGLEPRAFDADAVPGGTMIYTSGTSGAPKGVIRARPATVRDALEVWARAGRAYGFDGSGPHLVTGPLYHAAPLLFALYDLMMGAPMILMPRWSERAFLETVARHRVVHTHLVPTTMVRLLRLPEEERRTADLSSLRLVMHGAAPIRQETKRAMIDWLGDAIVEYWGATEGGIYTLVSAAEWSARPGTVGRAIPIYRIHAVDDAGVELPPLASGTLVCTHATIDRPFVYHRDAEKTERSYLGLRRFTVGDLGWVDADGYVHLGERRSNLILSGGVNLYPAEIEQVLARDPAIADVAVFGARDDEWGERVVAAIELRDGHAADDATRASILERARGSLAAFKLPRAIEFVPAVPRTEAGKLRLRDLREAYERDGTLTPGSR